MPTPTAAQLGPLAPLVGTWEGDDGLDVSFHNETQLVEETRYRERTVFTPFGPVDNGKQSLFGLAEVARTTRFECAITTGDGTFGYAETTTVAIAAMGGTLAHTDTNTLVRIPDDGS